MTYRISNTNSLRTFNAATGGSELYRFLSRETQSSPCWHMNITNASTIYPDTSYRSQLSTEILPSAVSRDLVSLSDMPVIPNERLHITYQREKIFASRLPVNANLCRFVADGPLPPHLPFFSYSNVPLRVLPPRHEMSILVSTREVELGADCTWFDRAVFRMWSNKGTERGRERGLLPIMWVV